MPNPLAARSAILLLLAGLAGCASVPAPRPVAAAPAFEGPAVPVDSARLEAPADEACARVEERLVQDHAAAALAAGMLLADYEAFRRTALARRVTVAFRDSNPACLPHLAAGVRSKGHGILQKTWDASNLGPEHQHLAGLVSDRFQKPPKGERVDDPKLTLLDGEPVTCDHDLMDAWDESGRRLAGETPEDLALRGALNAALPETPRGHRDRVLHGSQATYGDYLAAHPAEEPVRSLFRLEAPLTAFDRDGRVWRLLTVDEAVDFYRCREVPFRPEWRFQER